MMPDLFPLVPSSPLAPERTPAEARSLKRFRARWLSLLVAVALALYVCWLMLEPFIDVLLWATVLTIIFYPVHLQIVRRTRHPATAALLSCILVVAVVVIPLGLVGWAVVNEATGVARYLQQHAPALLDPHSRFVQFMGKYVVDLEQLDIRTYLIERLQNVGGSIAAKTVGVVGSVLVILFEIVFVVITMYYLFRDGERIKTALIESLPLDRGQSQRIFDRTREVISASVFGVMVIASIQAILGEIGFLVVRLPSPLLWGVVLFFLSMIPMAGSFLVWVPACIYLVAVGHWGWAIFLAAWCAGVVGMVDNVARPRLVGKRTRLHELLIFFSVLGGLQVFGPLGLVVGPVVVAITLALLDVFRKADRGADWTEPTLAEQQAALRNVPPEDEPRDIAPTGDEASTAPTESRRHRRRKHRDNPQPSTAGDQPIP